MTRTHRLLVLSAALLAAVLGAALSASAWPGDFFDGDASGQAVYEDMAIHPQSVRLGDSIYVVYQGFNLDPYLVVFSDDGSIDGPYKLGDNPLSDGSNPDDSHGAPAILADSARGLLHVFWGAHGTTLRHAKVDAAVPTSFSVSVETRLGGMTYPQVFADESGVAHLFYRRDAAYAGTTTTPAAGANSWWHARSFDGGSTWNSARPVLNANNGTRYYAHFERGAGDAIHLVATTQKTNYTNPWERTGVYYLKRDPSTGRWTDARGAAVGTTATPLVLKDLQATSTVCAVPVGAGEFHNGVTAADDGSGAAGLLFVGGGAYGEGACSWTFARHDGSAWVTSTISSADYVMDSGALEYRDGGIDAYVTTGASLEATPSNPYDYRGGDIVWYRSEDGGESWSREETLAPSDRGRGLVYNDPQIVVGHQDAPPGAIDSHLLFGEWNNDAGAMVHKVYLWGKDGYRGREFFPELQRLAGKDRFETAVAISREAFPNGSDTVIVASGEGFADALAGGPLAEAYRAPLLLVPRNSLPGSVKGEIARLKARKVIVLGGTATVTDANAARLKTGSVSSVTRISGRDRYGTAASIASELERLKGTPKTVFVVSGESFADALSASSVAAARGLPVLLARPTGVPPATLAWLSSREVSTTIAVGGEASLSGYALSLLPDPRRVAGADRFATSAAVARLGLDGGHGLPPSFTSSRISVASGRAFPDALAGAALAARVRGPLVLTAAEPLSPASRQLLEQRAYRVLDCYLLGGEVSLTPRTATEIATILAERQAD